MVGIKIDQLDDEHGEQPLRRKPEETELPVECLHSEWTLNRFLLTYVLRHCCIGIDTNKSGVSPTKGSSTRQSRFARTLGNVQKGCIAAAFNQQSGTWKGFPRESSCPR